MFNAISSLSQWAFGTKTQAPVQNLEEDWVIVENRCRDIIVFQGSQQNVAIRTADTVEMPADDDNALVPFYTTRRFTPITGPLVEDVTDTSQGKMPIVEDADLSLALPTPSNSTQNRAVPGSIMTVAVAAGAAAQNAGIGAVIFETGVGTYCYSTVVNPHAWQLTQFIQIRSAQSLASSIVATTVGGVSLSVIANAVFAGVTVISVAWGAVKVYNALTSNETPIRGIDASRAAASRFLGIEAQKN